jgi:two-component system, sensor histidine kinase and response regulator
MKGHIKILLVEDSPMDADLLSRHLRKENIDFEYKRVWEREAFLDQLKNFAPDFIIADYNMPQFNGLEAFRLMKSENLHLPFLLMTGSLPEKMIQDIVKEGIDDYLLKDDLHRLSEVLQNVLRKRQFPPENK